MVHAAARAYRTDRWADQPCRIEVCVEKDADIGGIEAVCQRNDVPYVSCRGSISVPEIWRAAQRLRRHLESGQDVVVLQIGDHDPAGLEMTRDIDERLHLFVGAEQSRIVGNRVAEKLRAETDDVEALVESLPAEVRQRLWDEARQEVGAEQWGQLEIRRIALTYYQVLAFNPPPNPAQHSHAPFKRYAAETGLDESWELDALDPVVLQDLIQEEIDQIRDAQRWEQATAAMEDQRQLLAAVAERWQDVIRLVEATS
jgi:hypothetical protein